MAVIGRYTNQHRRQLRVGDIDNPALIAGCKYSSKGRNNELAKKRIMHSINQQFKKYEDGYDDN